MNNREIFKKNLNDLLYSSGKMQKDLAEFVGAKTTTVSGWTRGISYPRADAMEKIALFFGVPTSRLVGPSEGIKASSPASTSYIIVPDNSLYLKALNVMSPEDLSTLTSIFSKAFDKIKSQEGNKT